MDTPSAATRPPDPDAVEFVRFCYRRRRVGWPELYDEMCAVAGRGLFRGYGADDLAAFGIGFSLFHMPALAVLASRIVCEEQARQRAVRVSLTATPSGVTSSAEDVRSEMDIPVGAQSLARPGAVREPEARESAAAVAPFTMAASGV